MGGLIIKYRRLPSCVTTRQLFSQLCALNLTFALLDNLLISDAVSKMVFSLTIGIAYSFSHILNNDNWWGILGSNQSCRKAADLQSAESPLILLPHLKLGTRYQNRTGLTCVKGGCPNR